MDISGWVSHWAACTPAKTAVRFEGSDLTYQALEERVGRLASSLVASGVVPGDRVGYLGPNCPEVLEALFACARIGALFVPLNGRMPVAELTVFVRQCRPRVLLAQRAFEGTARACADEVVVFTAGDGIALGGSFLPWSGSSAGAAGVLILYTSGTTGSPKGAVLTNDAVTANVLAAVTGFQLTSADELLTVTPMFHIAGLNLLTTPVLFMGGTVTVHRDFDAGRVLREIDQGSVTLLLSPPPLSRQLASHPSWERTRLQSLRCVMTGGTTVTQASVDAWHQRGVPVVQGYGMTEAGSNVTLVPLAQARSRSTTAGKAAFGSRIRLLSAAGADVGPGEEGEIVVQTPSMMREYWDNPEATSPAIPDGWLRTGDVGRLDADGFLRVVDRLKEVIIVGTSNVYPADLEAVLADCPDIDDAAVVGRPDAELGEAPVAFVVAAEGRTVTQEQVLSLFDGRVAPYKKPREILFLPALPRTSLGKPHKSALRALAVGGRSA